MSLRLKTLIAISVVLLLLTVTSYSVLKTIIMDNLLMLEKSDLEQDVRMAVNILNKEGDRLQALTTDWAVWDDSYAFMGGSNPSFAEENLTYSTLAYLQVNFILFLAPDGQPFSSRSIDLPEAQPADIPDSLLEYFASHPQLLRTAEADAPLAGLVALPDHPVLLALNPILTSDGRGPVRGTLVMGRYVDDALIDQLSKTSLLNLSIEKLPQAAWPKSKDGILPNSDNPPLFVVNPLNDDYIEGYVTLNDLLGKPAVTLHSTAPRTLFKQGKPVIYYTALYNILIALLFGCLTLLIMEKLVLSRLYAISRELSHIDETGFDKRVSSLGDDELGRLSDSVNNTLAKLEKSHLDLAASNDRLLRITENMLDVLGQLDLEGRLVYCSPSHEKVLGTTQSEIIGQRFLDLVDSEDLARVAKCLNQVLCEGSSGNCEFRITRGTHSRVWMEAFFIR